MAPSQLGRMTVSLNHLPPDRLLGVGQHRVTLSERTACVGPRCVGCAWSFLLSRLQQQQQYAVAVSGFLSYNTIQYKKFK
jgi:hypothetical protein